MSTLRNVAIAVSATTACATLGSLATDPGSHWYRGLDLPDWQPPPIAFPVAWTALYVDLALASGLTVTELERAGESEQAAAYWRAFAVNLVLNAGWSVLFWRGRRPALAALGAAALTASSADLARRAGHGGRRHALALAPYSGWCAFATALSADIARRNRSR